MILTVTGGLSHLVGLHPVKLANGRHIWSSQGHRHRQRREREDHLMWSRETEPSAVSGSLGVDPVAVEVRVIGITGDNQGTIKE